MVCYRRVISRDLLYGSYAMLNVFIQFFILLLPILTPNSKHFQVFRKFLFFLVVFDLRRQTNFFGS